jgi:DNA-binding transcriptional regulator YhcF (GntR family)
VIKKIESYSETLFHLINFRCQQFRESRSILKIDYDSFMIMSVIGAHYLKNNTLTASDWDTVWENTRSKKIEASYKLQKLTIYALANIMELPTETVRRKVEALKKKKFISKSNKLGLLPTEKIEEIMKPFATKELHALSKFLKALKKHKSLDQLLELKE